MEQTPDQSIALLRFALAKSGVDPRSYTIAMDDDTQDAEDRIVLRKREGDGWMVYYVERGRRDSVALFQSGFDAQRFFYWTLTGADTHYASRAEFEQP